MGTARSPIVHTYFVPGTELGLVFVGVNRVLSSQAIDETWNETHYPSAAPFKIRKTLMLVAGRAKNPWLNKGRESSLTLFSQLL